MVNNSKYWKGYYDKKNINLFLNSKLDRMRYYLNSDKVDKSIKILKKNINKIDLKNNLTLIKKAYRKEFLKIQKDNLSNFEKFKLIFICKVLHKYFFACGYKIN